MTGRLAYCWSFCSGANEPDCASNHSVSESVLQSAGLIHSIGWLPGFILFCQCFKEMVKIATLADVVGSLRVNYVVSLTAFSLPGVDTSVIPSVSSFAASKNHLMSVACGSDQTEWGD